jgi:hypothetical protein
MKHLNPELERLEERVAPCIGTLCFGWCGAGANEGGQDDGHHCSDSNGSSQSNHSGSSDSGSKSSHSKSHESHSS